MGSRRHLAHRWARYSVLVMGADIEDGELAVPPIPREYVGLDRILQRWAVSVSGGMQVEVWDDSGVARPPPLDEHHAYIIDRIVCALKKRDRRLLTYWYRKNIGVRQIKKKLHVRTSEDLYVELTDALRVVSLRIRGCNSSSLISLSEMHDHEN